MIFLLAPVSHHVDGHVFRAGDSELLIARVIF
jgi:hypothetical protein